MHARDAIGQPGPVVHLTDLGEDLGIVTAARRRVAVLRQPPVVGRGWNAELAQNRLDPEVVVAGFDERYDFLLVGSIS
jgi:hypothetical protein